jgi:hypothetical protein
MLWTVSSLLVGCAGGGGGADYTLHLSPVVASPQAPFEGLDRIDLVLTPEVGEALRVSLGAPSSGSTPEVTGLPALDATRIAVEGYRDGERVMRGLTEPITAETGDVEASVFVATTETAAWMSAVADGVYLPLLMPLGGGRFWLGGGVENNRSGSPSKGRDDVLTLTLAPPDDGLMLVDAGTLPLYDDDAKPSTDPVTERMGATVTALTVAGTDEGKFLVTGGGRAGAFDTNGDVSASTSLYDPATDTWEDLPAAGKLKEARSEHIALENLLGNVVVWGGFGSELYLPNTPEYYDAASRSFTELDVAVGLGFLDSTIADLGTDGTLLCGGAAISGAEWTSSTTCVRVRLDGSGLDTFEDLPAGLAGAAMITLADGRILLTGGATAANAVQNGDSVAARASAWLYTPNTGHWGALSSSMTLARAGHRMVLLADGRVLIIGGASSYNLSIPPTDALSCVELYDPTDGSFSAVDGCDETDDAGGMPGRAYKPQVAYDPDYGVLIAGGLGADGSAQGGVSLFVPGE